jgi:hypothetical protein
MNCTTLADQLVAVLRQAGVERVYGIVADSLNPVVDAIHGTAWIDWVHLCDLEAGAFAATAEARLTGRLAVCACSCGSANTRLVRGFCEAHLSGMPVLALASLIPSEQIGTGLLQEARPGRLLLECGHFCELLSHAEQMPRPARADRARPRPRRRLGPRAGGRRPASASDSPDARLVAVRRHGHRARGVHGSTIRSDLASMRHVLGPAPDAGPGALAERRGRPAPGRGSESCLGLGKVLR